MQTHYDSSLSKGMVVFMVDKNLVSDRHLTQDTVFCINVVLINNCKLTGISMFTLEDSKCFLVN
jgi:hypothetical protein